MGADSLGRLSAALTELDARIRVDDLDEGLAFAHDQMSLAGMAMLNLTCPSGDFDVFELAGGPSGYDGLVRNSVTSGVGELEVTAAGIEDALHSKEEVGRDKDVRAAVVLRAFLRERPH